MSRLHAVGGVLHDRTGVDVEIGLIGPGFPEALHELGPTTLEQ